MSNLSRSAVAPLCTVNRLRGKGPALGLCVVQSTDLSSTAVTVVPLAGRAPGIAGAAVAVWRGSEPGGQGNHAGFVWEPSPPERQAGLCNLGGMVLSPPPMARIASSAHHGVRYGLRKAKPLWRRSIACALPWTKSGQGVYWLRCRLSRSKIVNSSSSWSPSAKRCWQVPLQRNARMAAWQAVSVDMNACCHKAMADQQFYQFLQPLPLHYKQAAVMACL